MIRIASLMGILFLSAGEPASAQIVLPAPRPAFSGGFGAPQTPPPFFGGITVPPPVNSPNLRYQPQLPGPIYRPNVPFGGYLGTGYLPYYPSVYGTNVNPSININVTVLPPAPVEALPIPRPATAPTYGVTPVEPVSRTSARLVLQVPETAEVWLNGEKTDQRGPMRVYESPTLNQGKVHLFEVKIRWEENGKVIEESRRLSLGAGESRTLIYISR